MGIENQPLRQLEGDHEPNTQHTVDGNTATDTYHIPGRPLPEAPAPEPADAATEVAETAVPVSRLVDVQTADDAYRTKDNIVRPPEDLPALSVEQLQAVVDRDEDAEPVLLADALDELRRREVEAPLPSEE